MGNPCSTQKPRSLVIAVFGLDNAGKTSLIKVLRGDSLDEVAPTIGFKSVSMDFKKRDINIYDLGGGARIRDIWKNYYAEIFGLIYVVDAADRTKVEENRKTFERLVGDSRIQQKPILFLLNKQDLRGALDEVEATELLSLAKIVNKFRSPCRVETCRATAGVGSHGDRSIRAGFAWLIEQIEERYIDLSIRIAEDIKERKEAERIEKEERRLRVEKARREREMEEEGEELNGGPEPLRPSKERSLPFRPLPEIKEERVSAEEEDAGGGGVDNPVFRNGSLHLSSANMHSGLSNTGLLDSPDMSKIPRLPPISPQITRRLPPLSSQSNPRVDPPRQGDRWQPKPSERDMWDSETAIAFNTTGKSNSDDTVHLSDATHRRKRKKKRLRRFQKTESISKESDSEDSVVQGRANNGEILSQLPTSEPRPPTPPQMHDLANTSI